MRWRCRRWRGILGRLGGIILGRRGIGPAVRPEGAGDAAARGLHAGQDVGREVKEPVHEDVMAHVRHKANGLHIQGGKGKCGVLVLGLADSAPGSDELSVTGGSASLLISTGISGILGRRAGSRRNLGLGGCNRGGSGFGRSRRLTGSHGTKQGETVEVDAEA